MTSEQIAELRQWCADSDNGMGDGAEGTGVLLDTPVLRQLLDEREALLAACKAVMASDAELNARIKPEHMGDAWYSRRLELERRERAALDAVTRAIAKAEQP